MMLKKRRSSIGVSIPSFVLSRKVTGTGYTPVGSATSGTSWVVLAHLRCGKDKGMGILFRSQHKYKVIAKIPLPNRTYVTKETTVDAHSESTARSKARRDFDDRGWSSHIIVSVIDLTPRRS